MIPGMGGMQRDAGRHRHAEGDMPRLFGIIDSMTADERRNPAEMIDPSRRRRIAAGPASNRTRSTSWSSSSTAWPAMMKKHGQHGHARSAAGDAEPSTRGHVESRGQVRQTEAGHRQAAHPRREAEAQESCEKRTCGGESGKASTPTRKMKRPAAQIEPARLLKSASLAFRRCAGTNLDFLP